MQESNDELPKCIKILLELWILKFIETTVPTEVLEKIGFNVEESLKKIFGVLE